jgi:microsomal dipeptidase-like Zn-dependent dipeptidase
MLKNPTVERKVKVIKTLLEREGMKPKMRRFGDIVKLTVDSLDVYVGSDMGWTNMVVAQDDITLFKSSDVEAIFRFLFDKAKLELATKTLSSLGYSKREIEKLLGGN